MTPARSSLLKECAFKRSGTSAQTGRSAVEIWRQNSPSLFLFLMDPGISRHGLISDHQVPHKFQNPYFMMVLSSRSCDEQAVENASMHFLPNTVLCTSTLAHKLHYHSIHDCLDDTGCLCERGLHFDDTLLPNIYVEKE